MTSSWSRAWSYFAVAASTCSLGGALVGLRLGQVGALGGEHLLRLGEVAGWRRRASVRAVATLAWICSSASAACSAAASRTPMSVAAEPASCCSCCSFCSSLMANAGRELPPSDQHRRGDGHERGRDPRAARAQARSAAGIGDLLAELFGSAVEHVGSGQARSTVRSNRKGQGKRRRSRGTLFSCGVSPFLSIAELRALIRHSAVRPEIHRTHTNTAAEICSSRTAVHHVGRPAGETQPLVRFHRRRRSTRRRRAGRFPAPAPADDADRPASARGRAPDRLPAGSTPTTYTSPIGGVSSRWTFVQWKPTSSPSRSARKKPFGSNQSCASRCSRSAQPPAALLRMRGEGGGVDREPGRLVAAGHEGAHRHARRPVRPRAARRPGRGAAAAAPATGRKPIRSRQRPRRRRRRREPRRAAAQRRPGRSTASSSARPMPWRRWPGRPPARRDCAVPALELGVTDHLAVPARASRCWMPAASVGQAQQGLLRERRDAVGGRDGCGASARTAAASAGDSDVSGFDHHRHASAAGRADLRREGTMLGAAEPFACAGGAAPGDGRVLTGSPPAGPRTCSRRGARCR